MVHNRTHTLNQDGLGYIWIGTDLGINRYDGRSFRHYPSPVATHYFARYSSRKGKEVLFTIDGFGFAFCLGDSVRFLQPANMSPENISGAICLANGNLLFNDAVKGLVQMDSNRITTEVKIPVADKSDFFVDIYRDRKGIVWLLSTKGLITFPENHPELAVRLRAFENTYINCVRESPEGHIYIACFTGVFCIAAKDRQQINAITPAKIFSRKEEVTCIEFDELGSIWLTTVYDGAYCVDPQKNELQHYTSSNGLISKNTWSLLCDREHNIWIGTEDGISKLSDKHYKSFDFRGSDFQNVKSGIQWDDSTLLLSNVTGVYKKAGNNLVRLEGVHSAVGYRSHVLEKSPDGKLWMTVSEPLPSGNFKVHTISFRLVGNRLCDSSTVEKIPGGPTEIFGGRGKVAISKQALLLSTDRGLKVYENGRFYPVKKTGNTSLTALCGRDSTCWVLWENKRLIYYRISPPKHPEDSFVLSPLQVIDSAKLKGRQYNGLFWDRRNRLWLSSFRFGLGVAYLQTDGQMSKLTLFPQEFCSSEIINEVSEDPSGNIWIAGAGGLDEMHEEGGRWVINKNRFGNLLCGKQIFFIRPFGDKMIAGTTGCVGVIDIQKEQIPEPLIYLTDVRINERSRPELLSKQNFTLRPSEDNVRFVFTGLYFRDEAGIKYSYRLEGVDSKWSTPGKDYSVTYSHLSPGSYTFRVKAVGPEGNWSLTAAQISFVIQQPYYTRWWFLLLCALGVSTLIYALYRYRINQVLAIQQIRQNISKDLHDDIGATVSSISILANMAGSELISDTKRKQFLDTIQEESRHVTESLSDIVWSINPKNDDLEIMIARMQRYATEMFEARNIQYSFSIPEPSGNEVMIPMSKRQHIYLIFKEAVNNLAKYSCAKNASITIAFIESTFKMVIKDDGVGFDLLSSAGGNGVLNMRKRAQEAGGSLQIWSNPGQGTEISLTMSV